MLESCQLLAQDIDFAANPIVVRGGKGDKDRGKMLPATTKTNLARHLETVRAQHHRDVSAGAGWVELPTALSRKYPNAGREWVWQWVFPATWIYRDRLTGQQRRHHLHESVLQRAVKAAVRGAGLPKRASPHTLGPVAAYLDSGRSVPTTTDGGFETPMCPIGASAPNRDTLQEVAGIVVLCRPAYPVAEILVRTHITSAWASPTDSRTSISPAWMS